MTAKISSIFLLVLMLSPCTAPFAAFDLATLLTASTSHHPLPPTSANAQPPSRDGAALSPVVTVCRTAGRIRFVALFGHEAPLAAANGAAGILDLSRALAHHANPAPLRTVLRI